MGLLLRVRGFERFKEREEGKNFILDYYCHP